MMAFRSPGGRGRAWSRALGALGRQASTHPLGAWLAAALFAAVGIHHVLNDVFLNDEGMLAYLFAGMCWDSPLDVFFWQKSRPILSLFYAPVAAGGLTVFLVVHVLVSSLAGPLAASVARSWGHRHPNLAAVLVLASPLMLAAGPAGVTNADAAVLAVFAVWLASRNRMISAGLVLGALLFVRAELVLLVLALGSLAAFERRFRPILLGIAAIPAAYWLLGILYHHDLAWIVNYPPTLTSPNPGNLLYAQQVTVGGAWTTVPTLMALTPALGLAVLARRRGLPLIEWACMAFAIAFLLAIRGLPYLDMFNFGSSPRYILPALPFAAWMVTRTFTRWHETGEPRWSTGWLILLLVVAHLADTRSGWPWLLPAVAVWAMLAALAGYRRVGPAVGLAVVAALVPVPWLLPATDLAVADTRGELAPAVAWLADHPQVARAGPVYTNMHLLATYAEHTGAIPRIDVRQIVQSDQLHELTELSNPYVGQRARILGLLERHFYARPVLPGDLRPENLPVGTLFVLSDDGRLESVMPGDLWRPHLQTLASGTGWRILAARTPR